MCSSGTSSRASALLVGAALLATVADAATVERRLGVMGTSLVVEVEADDRARALEASEAAVRAIEDTEQRLSTWREDSEFSKLNRARAGESVALSPNTVADLRAALACAEATGGAFDPTLGALVQAWDLRGEGRNPSTQALQAARVRTGFQHLSISGNEATRRADVLLEEGGFGKGAALDWAAAALQRSGAKSASIDIGGQVLVFGKEAAISIAHPGKREAPAVELTLSAGSLATTGNSVRAKVVDGQRIGHVLDPRTGRPAREIGSVSVIASTGATADCLSTALYVLGPRSALEWAKRRPGVEVIILEEVDAGLRVRASASLRGKLRAARGVSVKFEFDDEGPVR